MSGRWISITTKYPWIQSHPHCKCVAIGTTRVKPDIYRISLDRFHSFACSVAVPWVFLTWNWLVQIFTSCVVAPRSAGQILFGLPRPLSQEWWWQTHHIWCVSPCCWHACANCMFYTGSVQNEFWIFLPAVPSLLDKLWDSKLFMANTLHLYTSRVGNFAPGWARFQKKRCLALWRHAHFMMDMFILPGKMEGYLTWEVVSPFPQILIPWSNWILTTAFLRVLQELEIILLGMFHMPSIPPVWTIKVPHVFLLLYQTIALLWLQALWPEWFSYVPPSHPPTPQTTMCNIACKCVRKVTWTLLPHPTQQNPTFNLMTGTYSKSGTTTRSFPPASLNIDQFYTSYSKLTTWSFSWFFHGFFHVFPWKFPMASGWWCRVILAASPQRWQRHWMGGDGGPADYSRPGFGRWIPRRLAYILYHNHI